LATLLDLQNVLGIEFNDPDLLRQALIHSSYVHENSETAPVSNERLEYLGDAVLGLVFADMLFKKFPQYHEGRLTRLRSLLVRRSTLFRVASKVGLGDYLYLGRGEESSAGRQKPANLASALEAVIAAVYLDKRLRATKSFILDLFREEIDNLLSQKSIDDYKSLLQEMVQAKKQPTPVYNIVKSSGPDHEKMFIAEVSVGEQIIARGSGASKKKAESEAARIALDLLDDTLQD
jgi:ribonuclease III